MTQSMFLLPHANGSNAFREPVGKKCTRPTHNPYRLPSLHCDSECLDHLMQAPYLAADLATSDLIDKMAV